MFPPLQWDKLQVWSWLKGEPLQGCMQFGVECDPMQYDSKVGTIERIHSLNLRSETISKVFKKHPIRATC